MAFIASSQNSEDKAIQTMLARLNEVGVKPPEVKPTMFEKIIDLIGRSEYASASAAKSFLKGESGGQIAKSAMGGLSGKNKFRYEQLLEEQGVPEKGRGVKAFALGTLLDPLTYLPYSKIVKGGLKLASPVTKGIAKAIPASTKAAVSAGITSTKKSLGGLFGVPGWKLAGVKGAKETTEFLSFLPKIRRAQFGKGFKEAVDEARDATGKMITEKEAFKVMKLYERGQLNKLSPPLFKMAKKMQTQTKKLFKSEKAYGLVKGKQLPNYMMHNLTREAREYLERHAPSNPAIKGLIQEFGVRPIPTRQYLPGSKFLGKKLEEGTVQEINSIAKRRFTSLTGEKFTGNFFEPDIVASYAMRNATSRSGVAMMESFNDFSKEMIEKKIFAPILGTAKSLPQKGAFKQLYTGGERLTKEAKKGIQTHLNKGNRAFKHAALKGFQAPADLVDEIERTLPILTGDKTINKFVKAYDKLLGRFKFGVTVPFPSFHALNFSGGQFTNIMLADVNNPMSYSLAKKGADFLRTQNPVLGKEIVKIGGVSKSLEAWLKPYQFLGGGIGMVRGELKQEVGKFVSPTVKQGTAKRLVSKGLEKAGGVGTYVEDLNRLPIFFDRMAKGKSNREAILDIFKYHFDYSPEALSAFEREGLKRIIPFYRWTRGNIPLQIQGLFNRTGRYAATFRAFEAAMPGTPEERRAEMPEWMRRTLTVPVPPALRKMLGVKEGDKGYFNIQLPIADISRIEPRVFLSQIFPLLRVPVEMVVNQSFFFGNKIWNPNLPAEMQTSKAYPILKALPKPLRKMIGFKEFDYTDPVTKEKRIRYEADSKKLYALRNMLGPISRVYSEIGGLTEDLTQEGMTYAPTMGLESIASPFGVAKVDPQRQEYYKGMEMQQTLAQMISYMKKRGLIPESDKKSSLPSFNF